MEADPLALARAVLDQPEPRPWPREITLARALIAKHAEVSALEGLLMECREQIAADADHDRFDAEPGTLPIDALLSRLDAALTPDKEKDGR